MTRRRGFTLVEMVIAITLIGLLSVVAAPMLRLPLAAWMDASRRSAMTNAIDATDSRLRDDLQRALPNSVRVMVVGPRVLLETLELRSWGRHRVGDSGAAAVCPAACAGPNDALEGACLAERCFTSLGPLQGDPPLVGDWVVVNPLAANAGANAGDAYFGGSVALNGGIKSRLTSIAASPGGQVLNVNPQRFPSIALSRRFYVVASPVTWDCNPGAQTLTRRWGYAISQVQPAAFAAGSNAVLATRVTACSIAYTAASPINPRGGQVQVQIRMTAMDNIGVPEVATLSASYAVTEDR